MVPPEHQELRTRRTVAIRSRHFAVDWPHLAFATAIALWCAWFCVDAWRAQDDVENLILILPGSAAALILYGFVAIGCIRRVGDSLPWRPPLPRGIGTKIAGTMALLAAYVVAAPQIGFDIVSFFYLLAMLYFLGERRIFVLLLVPAVFCAVVIYGFAILLATPLPLLLFPDAG